LDPTLTTSSEAIAVSQGATLSS